VTVRELPVSKTMAGVNMRLTPEAFANCTGTRQTSGRSYSTGSARITAIDRDGKSFVADVKKMICGISQRDSHSIQGLDPDGTEFMLVFDDGNFSESETVLLTTRCRTCRPRSCQRTSVLPSPL